MESIPNGHFVDGLVWYDLPRGDALLAKGFRIELGDLSGASIDVLNSFHAAMTNLLFGLPDGVTLQSQWRVTSDYRDALEPYHAETVEKAGNRWTRFVREEFYYRLTEQMERGQLRREEHVLWFSQTCEYRVVESIHPREGGPRTYRAADRAGDQGVRESAPDPAAGLRIVRTRGRDERRGPFP